MNYQELIQQRLQKNRDWREQKHAEARTCVLCGEHIKGSPCTGERRDRKVFPICFDCWEKN